MENSEKSSSAPGASRGKTYLFLFLVVISNALGNAALSAGMKHATGSLLGALIQPWVVLGIALLIAWTLMRMALLSWADLSYVLPMTSIGYVLNAMMGRYFLGETVTPERWLGTLLIVGGAVLVGTRK